MTKLQIMYSRNYKLPFLILALILAGNGIVWGQSTKVVYSSINISVNVMNNITVGESRNIQLTINGDNQDEVNIDPSKDPHAGMFSAAGFGNASLRISYPQKVVLRNSKTGQTILFTLKIAGNDADDQTNSKLLQNNPVNVTFSSKGKYFFWVGGRASIKNAPEGSYTGNIDMNVDYN